MGTSARIPIACTPLMRGPDRPIVQFERKAPGPASPSLANFGKEGRPEPIVGNFSQETLAEMIGTTRSRVSFFMNKFRKLGFIEYNGKLEVHNSLLNVVLHDQPEIKTRDEEIRAE
jgi:Crp-like helix-turn-helix domain